MKSKDEIFEGKSFQDLTKDIYRNTTDRKKQIDLLISEIHGFITTIDDVILVAPIIKEYKYLINEFETRGIIAKHKKSKFFK